ncbi:hypothetical protein [Natronobeatus ordinarius]|uniref:hypothetical protein n=1 Tax=Natronobeatus ordinarius TaxID=2963433 RepID=UPI0020CC7EF2|nr:hypothetical protein [Natronobeatus ordinarius]
MQSELFAELFSVLLYVLIAAVLTVGGLAAEYASLQYFGAGDSMAALWLAGAGLVMLYAGLYGVGYGKVLSRFV